MIQKAETFIDTADTRARHGKPRSNETHLAPHEPQAKLFRKGKGHLAKLYDLA